MKTKHIYPKRIQGKTFHLCPLHCDSLGCSDCSMDSWDEHCQITQARKHLMRALKRKGLFYQAIYETDEGDWKERFFATRDQAVAFLEKVDHVFSNVLPVAHYADI